MVRSIVVGTDGSPHANAALREAIDLARSEGARLHVVTAIPDPSRFHETLASTATTAPLDLRGVADNILGRAGRAAEEAGVEYDTHAREEEPADAILEVAREVDADLVVVGSRGLRGVTQYLLGSVSQKVTHHAECSVWVVRAPAEATA